MLFLILFVVWGMWGLVVKLMCSGFVGECGVFLSSWDVEVVSVKGMLFMLGSIVYGMLLRVLGIVSVRCVIEGVVCNVGVRSLELRMVSCVLRVCVVIFFIMLFCVRVVMLRLVWSLLRVFCMCV